MRASNTPIVLVGNYPPDQQHSMLQYACMLERDLRQLELNVVTAAPEPIFAKLGQPNKWLGYLDKLLLFPGKLKRTIQQVELNCGNKSIVHICDHSNSPLLKATLGRKTLLTCHDLIAIRSGMGQFPGETPRWTGRILQHKIRQSIPLADRIACVSNATEQDLHAVLPSTIGRTSVVHNGFNATFTRQPQKEASAKLAELGIPEAGPMLLHVGSNAWYKNRLGVLKIFHGIRQHPEHQDAHLVLAGPELDPTQAEFIDKHGLRARVKCTGPVEHAHLQALYSKAAALLFPSRHEGFGWPPVEAQSCGCPVVASRNGSLAEIIADSAPTTEWDDTQRHVQALKRILTEPHYKEELVSKGHENIKRFSAKRMAEAFCTHYSEMATTIQK